MPAVRSLLTRLAAVSLWIWAALAVLILALAFFALRAWSTDSVSVTGLPPHPIRPDAVGALRIQARSPASLHVSIDGRPIATTSQRDALTPRAPALADGPHQLQIDAPRLLPWLGSTTTTQQFTVDSVPPVLRVPDSLDANAGGAPLAVNGSATGATQVTVAGHQVPVNPQGGFTTQLPRPDKQFAVVATDAAGNSTQQTVSVHFGHPPMHAVHMTGLAWTADTLREPVLQMAREHKIDTVELDIKDESGEVQYESAVPLAQQIGAVRNYYDPRQVIDQLHGMGVRVVGRIVAFEDPILGTASWNGGNPQRVVQNAQGQPWSAGGSNGYSFTNFADPVVREYNIDLAKEAASLGFDDVLYDYVRRPDGPIDQMRFPELTTTPEASVADFLRQTRIALNNYPTLLGASVFGISVNRPTQIGQDIPQMAKYTDYIAPMVYPSHWGQGEFNVANPNLQPYDIVQRSLSAFASAANGTGAQIIPWLQDFSLGAPYGPDQVKAQIAAASSDGLQSFLLWSPACQYHDQALNSP